MKIIDETGAVVESPDLTLGYLTDDTEPVEHPAVEGVEEVSHYETVTEYPGAAGMCGRSLMCRAYRQDPRGPSSCPSRGTSATPPKSWPRRKKRAKKAEAREKLPDTVAALQKENEMLKQCLLEMSEIVYA